jgi:GTP-binding protein HflX
MGTESGLFRSTWRKYANISLKLTQCMPKIHDTAPKQETAVLVAVSTPEQSNEQTQEYLDELAFLAETFGIRTVKTFAQRLQIPHNKTFVGKGKLEEILRYVQEHQVDCIIFDDDLSPSQIRNLEKEIKCKILDRSLLIIYIFALRAKTAQAKTQVELAQWQYLLPRLTRMWTHLERQRGGTGTRGGAGEKEIETDRRIVKDKITLLREKLDKIEKQSDTRRKSRDGQVRVALVGYTNVGKSTLMTLLSKSDVFAENKLFATVDATVRKVVIEQRPFLLTDTVGFIRKLPTMLIECFKSTLDEIREADILLHVVDISHPSFEEQIQVVHQTLKDIGATDKKVMLVFNKIDLYYQQKAEEGESPETLLKALQKSYLGQEADEVAFISAARRENIDQLRKLLAKMVSEKYYQIFPNNLQLPE